MLQLCIKKKQMKCKIIQKKGKKNVQNMWSQLIIILIINKMMIKLMNRRVNMRNKKYKM